MIIEQIGIESGRKNLLALDYRLTIGVYNFLQKGSILCYKKEVGGWLGPRLSNTGAENTVSEKNVAPTSLQTEASLEVNDYW